MPLECQWGSFERVGAWACRQSPSPPCLPPCRGSWEQGDGTDPLSVLQLHMPVSRKPAVQPLLLFAGVGDGAGDASPGGSYSKQPVEVFAAPSHQLWRITREVFSPAWFSSCSTVNTHLLDAKLIYSCPSTSLSRGRASESLPWVSQW